MIRATRLEIIRFCDGNRERSEVWRELTIRCQEISNRIWQVWEQWHLQNGTPQKIRESLDKYKAWAEGGKKGKLEKDGLLPLPQELQKTIYDRIMEEFPDVSTRTRSLIINIISQGIKSRKAANGSLAGWKAILLCREGRPSFTRPQPIPIDKRNARKHEPLCEQEGEILLRVSVERQEDGKHIYEDCRLKCKTKKTRSQLAILRKLIDGTYEFKGSKILFSPKDRKWYAFIAFEQPEPDKPAVDAKKSAVLCPGRDDPWLLQKPGGIVYRGGLGRHVEATRRSLTISRRSRQENYRYAGGTTKGRGRNRAIAGWTKYQSRWKEFVKRYNHEVTSRIVNECVSSGIGRLVYLQPVNDKRETRFLSRAGKCDLNESTLWDYHQVGSMLGYKCQEVGIDFEVKQVG